MGREKGFGRTIRVVVGDGNDGRGGIRPTVLPVACLVGRSVESKQPAVVSGEGVTGLHCYSIFLEDIGARGLCLEDIGARGVELIDEEEYIVSFMFVFSFFNFRLID